MNRKIAAPLFALALAGCATSDPGPHDATWTTLIDGATMSGLHPIQAANWHPGDGAIVADKGIGFLMTDKVYGDFQIRAEFYAEADTNSGVFLRCSDAMNPDAKVCYEVNIWDVRPAPEYGTGAIVDVAKVTPAMPKAGGHWNTYEITAKGDHITVVLNGVTTADAHDAKHAVGQLGLQYAAGNDKAHPSVLKWRKVQIKSL
jgi:Domain of Unknown Function (DUF1080)